MSPPRRPLPPTSSLPPLRSLDTLTADRILEALGNLYTLYCPLPPSLAFQQQSLQPGALKEAPATEAVDSGYTSGNEDEDVSQKQDEDEETLAELRNDAYERAFAERWLTGFIGRAEELTCFETEEALQRAIDKASCVLASFFAGDEDEDDEAIQITRNFQFALSPEQELDQSEKVLIDVRLNDGLAGRDNADHTDVGLQSWGAAIVFSELICASPSRFGFTKQALGPASRIVELGAGTGLVGIVLGKMLPHLDAADSTVIATDFHPTVLENLRANITANFSSLSSSSSVVPAPVQAAPLDWSAPDLSGPLRDPADMLVATDVIYDPAHAAWLRDCAARVLAPHGTFWMLVTVRETGKFEGITDTVRRAFTGRDGLRDGTGRVLAILEEERLERQVCVGRAGEREYRLFRIGWAAAEVAGGL
ncbi:putative methyltransferase-domain-containing protein [Biscogniauxia mediterranea]|nr:putative methyltransferase-domain-containing protein [Biscogniauxia mediterranea]